MNHPYKSLIRRFTYHPKLIIFGFYCVLSFLVGALGITVMAGWLNNIPVLTRLYSTLPPIPFHVAFSFTFLSLALLLSLAKNYKLSQIIGVLLLLFNAIVYFHSLMKLDLATDFPILRSHSPNAIPVKISLAFCFLCCCIVIYTYKEKKQWHFWLIAILSSIIFAMSLSAIFSHLNRIDEEYIWIRYNKIDLHIAVGLFISSSVIVYLTYLKFRAAFPNFCLYWLSLLGFISLLWSTISFYDALKNQETFYKRSSLDHEASQMLKFVIHQSNTDKKSLKRIVGRWNAMDNIRVDLWKKDAKQLVWDIKPLRGLAILKPDKTVLANISQNDFPLLKLLDNSKELLELHEEGWYPIKNEDGRNILFTYFLLDFPKSEKGYLVAFYDLESMINTYPKFLLQSKVCENIFYKDRSLYFSDDKAILSEKNTNEDKFIFSKQQIGNWKLLMWTLSQDPNSFSRFPEIFLVLGVLMSFLIGTIFHLYQKFKRQSHLLFKANAAKSLFLANVSHEIRTPLHAIIGTVSLLDFTELDSRQEHLVHILKTSSNHLLDLINNLLDITKIESGNITLKYVPVNIQELSLDVISLLSDKAEEKGLHLRFDCHAPENKMIDVPAREIKQIMTNLLSNAIKFTDSGIITLEINVVENGPHKGILNINVSDTGIGIPEDKKRFIFEKFSQVVTDEKIKHSGTGLGLFISKLLVDEMKGQIRFESIDGQGSTFFVSIPVSFVHPKAEDKENDHEKT